MRDAESRDLVLTALTGKSSFARISLRSNRSSLDWITTTPQARPGNLEFFVKDQGLGREEPR